MPCAIDFHMAAAISPSDGTTFEVAAADFNGEKVECEPQPIAVICICTFYE